MSEENKTKEEKLWAKLDKLEQLLTPKTPEETPEEVPVPPEQPKPEPEKPKKSFLGYLLG